MYSDDDLDRLLAKTDWNLPLGHLSPSQVWAYVSCPACYEAERILRIPKPMSADLLIGLKAHRAAQVARLALLDGRIDPEQPGALLDEFIAAGDAQFDGVIEAGRFPDESGDIIDVEVELTKKYADLDDARAVATRLIQASLPEMLAYDRTAGVEHVEARVWGLGTPLDPATAHTPDEAQDYADEAAEALDPVFPFPVKAFLDVLYSNSALKDYKTAGKSGAPDNLARIQLVMYGSPWWKAGEPLALGWDVAIKTKTPGFASYWIKSALDPELPPGSITDEEYRYVLWRVLRAAEGISAGRFDPNDGSIFCKYGHGLPDAERAVTNFAEIAS